METVQRSFQFADDLNEIVGNEKLLYLSALE